MSARRAERSTIAIPVWSSVAYRSSTDASCSASGPSSPASGTGRCRRASWRTARRCSRPRRARPKRRPWPTWRSGRCLRSSMCCTPSRCTSSSGRGCGRPSSGPGTRPWKRGSSRPRRFPGRTLPSRAQSSRCVVISKTVRRAASPIISPRSTAASRVPEPGRGTGRRPGRRRTVGRGAPCRGVHGIGAPAWHNTRLPKPDYPKAIAATENCIKCKYMDCVEVCPVDCFHEGPNFLVIDPDECIDCTLCEPECPAEAIFSEEELPAGQEQFKKLNAELAKQWPVITEKKDAPADAKEWDGKPEKLKLLEK